jgi:hypothetical protein
MTAMLEAIKKRSLRLRSTSFEAKENPIATLYDRYRLSTVSLEAKGNAQQGCHSGLAVIVLISH